ncbi:hypothetical protein LINGRAPRIM_LOCUS2184 [Linum grandiflorum]
MADNNNNNAIITIGPFPFFPDFRFQFPNPLHRKPQPSHRIVASDDRTVSSSSDGKPDALKFTERKPSPAPPLRLEVDEPSNPLITYSVVYAMGGFIIVKWVWARWNERKERAKKGSSSSSSEAEETQNPENESPGEGED